MTIAMAEPLKAGNAVQLTLSPPRGAIRWRVLRRPVDAFSGPTDPAASKVADDCTDRAILDIIGLQNGTTYYYRVYYRSADGAWMDPPDAATATPMASYRGDDFDAQSFVRDRIEAGLAVEVSRTALRAPARTGRIEVLLAPFALSDNTQFPLVSVHLAADGAADRAVGETLLPDSKGSDGAWTETEGWLARVSLNIVGVSANPNERLALRRALRRIVQANLSIFDAMGMDLCEFHQRDEEDSEHFNVPLYFTVGSFTCLAPAYVSADVADIDEVRVTASRF